MHAGHKDKGSGNPHPKKDDLRKGIHVSGTRHSRRSRENEVVAQRPLIKTGIANPCAWPELESN